MRKILFYFLLLNTLCFLQSPAQAQILIEQGKVNLSVVPGETVSDVISVHNTSKDQLLHLKVYWEDFEYVAPFDGKKKFIPRSTSRFSCSNWISFSPTEITLEPLSKKNINYSIRVPEDAKGGYYGVMFFESKSGSPQGDIGVKIVARVGSLFFIETTNSDKSVEIGNFIKKGKTLLGDFKNIGNIFVIPKGIFYILDAKGHAVERGEISKLYLPPDEKTTFTIPLAKELRSGNYTIVLTFDLGDGSSIVREIDFTVSNADNIRIKSIRD